MEKRRKEEIEQLEAGRFPHEKEAYGSLLRDLCEEDRHEERAYLFENARKRAQAVYGNKIYIRGLIEISNICRNNCYYCGIRKDNRKIERYRLDEDTILACCQSGYEKGFRTFVAAGRGRSRSDRTRGDRFDPKNPQGISGLRDYAVAGRMGKRELSAFF